MKNKLLILCFLAPLTALSCPELAGTYDCKSLYGNADKSTKITITQVENTYTVNYGSGSNTFTANGKPSVQTVIHPDTGIPLKLTLTGVCEGERLTVNGKNGFPKIEGTAQIEKAGSSLLVEIEGQLLGQRLNERVICEN